MFYFSWMLMKFSGLKKILCIYNVFDVQAIVHLRDSQRDRQSARMNKADHNILSYKCYVLICAVVGRLSGSSRGRGIPSCSFQICFSCSYQHKSGAFFIYENDVAWNNSISPYSLLQYLFGRIIFSSDFPRSALIFDWILVSGLRRKKKQDWHLLRDFLNPAIWISSFREG